MSTDQYSINYYSMLGVTRDGSTKEINIAFKKLALKLHPDKSGGDRALLEQFHKVCDHVEELKTPDLSHILLLEKFGLIILTPKAREAVETLRDPERRRRYDELLVEDTFAANTTYHPQFSQFRAQRSPDKHGKSGYYAAKDSSPQQERKGRHDMWGPFIHAYSTNPPPRPTVKRSKVVTPQPATKEKGQPLTEGIGVYVQAQKTDTDRRERDVRNPALKDKDEKDVKKEVADTNDPKVDKLVNSENESIFLDAAEHGSVTSSSHDHESSSSSNSKDSHGLDESSFANGETCSQEENQGDDETMHMIYFDCAEHLGSVSTDGHTNTVDDGDEDIESEVGDEQPSIQSSLRPFVRHLQKRLKSSGGCYTTEDLLTELNGLVMDAVCVWLDGQRLLFSKDGASTSNNVDRTEGCEHIGCWKKHFHHPECEVCHLWKPTYVLTCPGCGKKACVRCKYMSTASV